MSENDKLKYWLDAEISFLHIILAVIIILITDSLLFTVVLGFYALYRIVYMTVRYVHVGSDDPGYLEIKK